MGNESDLIREGNKQQDNSKTIRQTESGKSAAESWNTEASKANNISAIDGQSIIYIDHRWAQSEYNKLSPEAKREVDTNVNNIFTMRNSEFASGKKLDANNLEHRPYIAQQSRIRDELMTWQKDGKTGKEYWEAEVNNNRELSRDINRGTTLEKNAQTSVTDLPTGASESSVTSSGEVNTTPRQNRIWPEEQAMTGKMFRDHVTTETTIYGGKKDAAFLIAGKLKDGDLTSRAMKTPEGLAGLRVLNDAMNPEGISGVFTGLSENEMKEKTRIANAITKIDNELHPPVEYGKGKKAFDENFPRYAEELKKGIEKNKNYQVEKIYHQPFTAKAEQIRAVVLESKELTDHFGETHTIKDRRDICLGGVDLTRKGAFIDAQTIETHGTVQPSALQADDILGIGAAIGLAGKYLMKGALKGVGRLAATEGASTATALGRELGEDAIERGVRGVDAFAPTQRMTRIGDESVDVLGQTQRAARIETSDSPVDALAKTENINPAAGFNEAATSQNISRIRSGEHAIDSQSISRSPLEKPPSEGKGLTTEPPIERSSPESRGLTTEPGAIKAPAAPGFFHTFETYQPGRIGYEGYLGRDLHARAQNLGMDNDILYNYIDTRIYRREIAELSASPELVQSRIQNIVNEQIGRLENFHATPEIRRAITLGRDPEDIIIQADRLVSNGLTPAQVGRQIHNQNEFLAYCAREFHDGSVASLRASLRVAEDVEGAAVNGYIKKEFTTWQAKNPGRAADMALLNQWENEARIHVTRQWNHFMNQP